MSNTNVRKPASKSILRAAAIAVLVLAAIFAMSLDTHAAEPSQTEPVLITSLNEVDDGFAYEPDQRAYVMAALDF